jgi:hypothetical protein
VVNCLANGNGVLAKLATLRQRHMAEFQGEVARFRINVQQLREKYLNELVELTMTDPNIAAVQKALDFFRPSREEVTVISSSGPGAQPEGQAAAPTEVDPAVAATLAPPEKETMKAARKVSRRSVYGSCPNCNSPIWVPGSKFCSQCAYPLDEAQ